MLPPARYPVNFFNHLLGNREVPEGADAKNAGQEELRDADGGGWNTLRAAGHARHRKDAGAGASALLQREAASNGKRNRFAVNGGSDRS